MFISPREKRNPSAKKTCQWQPGSWLFLKYICVSFQATKTIHVYTISMFWVVSNSICVFFGVSNHFLPHHAPIIVKLSAPRRGQGSVRPIHSHLVRVSRSYQPPASQGTKWSTKSSEQSHRIQYNWDWNYLPTFSCLILLVHACKCGQIYQSHRILWEWTKLRLFRFF